MNWTGIFFITYMFLLTFVSAIVLGINENKSKELTKVFISDTILSVIFIIISIIFKLYVDIIFYGVISVILTAVSFVSWRYEH